MTKEDLERLDSAGMAAWDSHDIEAWVNLFADDFIWTDWTLPEPIRDKEGARNYFRAWIEAFPDMRAHQIRRIVGDDSVAAEIEFTATNSGPLRMGGNELPATNRKVVGRGTYFAREQGGKVVEFHSHPDVAGMMMQLGMMPGA
jgi:predicted ester cyclase